MCNLSCLKQDTQIVLLLNGTTSSSESSGDACMMIVQTSELPFIPISRSLCLNLWNLHQLKVTSVTSILIHIFWIHDKAYCFQYYYSLSFLDV